MTYDKGIFGIIVLDKMAICIMAFYIMAFGIIDFGIIAFGTMTNCHNGI
jgi:hypothetical protein